ncbi:MAG: hypothetical protein HGB18_04755 [Candidatus Moranbacteria bacterium]|nr:hypothetical protein [Candidatus Moranbacteria bacterium]
MDRRLVGIGAIVAGAVALAGCSSPGSGSQDQDHSQAQDQVRDQDKSGVAEWVAGLASGKRMRCEYSFGDGDKATKTVMYMERDRYRTEVGTPAGDMISLFDGKAMYSWTKGGKQGMKMDIECMKRLGEEVPKGEERQEPTSGGYESPQEALENIPNIACSVTADSIDFSVPSDVTFADQCEMMKGMLDKAKTLQGQAGALQGQIPDSVKGMMGGQR